MIRYALRCSKEHDFDAWFRSSAAFDQLQAAGQVECTICGDKAVTKTVMAPAVAGTRRKGAEDKPLSAPPANPMEKAMRQMREHLEKNADYVGPRFAEEARRLHAEATGGEGESADKDAAGRDGGGGRPRQIYGEATREEARSLIEDGIPVAPLPFRRRDD